MIDSPPWRSRLTAPARAVYLGLAMVVGWILAIVLASGHRTRCTPHTRPRPPDPAASPRSPTSSSPPGVMWVPGSIPLAIAILFVAYRWLEPKRSRQPDGTHPLAGNP